MSKVLMRYTSYISRAVTHHFPVVAAFFLSLLFTISVVRYVSDTQQTEVGKTFHVAKAFVNN